MREIKFRAWDKKHKEWLDQEYYNLIGFDSNFYSYSMGKLLKEPLEELDIQQFTGFKDKNGKEIYEGDIFECPYSNKTEHHHKWRIIWGEISGGFVLQRIGKPCNQRQVYQTVSDMTRQEIIGNICENPELLSK